MIKLTLVPPNAAYHLPSSPLGFTSKSTSSFRNKLGFFSQRYYIHQFVGVDEIAASQEANAAKERLHGPNGSSQEIPLFRSERQKGAKSIGVSNLAISGRVHPEIAGSQVATQKTSSLVSGTSSRSRFRNRKETHPQTETVPKEKTRRPLDQKMNRQGGPILPSKRTTWFALDPSVLNENFCFKVSGPE